MMNEETIYDVIVVGGGISGAMVSATVRWSRPVEEMWAIGIAFDGATATERAAVDALVKDVEVASR